MTKSKRSNQVGLLLKQGKSARPPEHSFGTDPRRSGTNSTIQVPTVKSVNLPTKLRSRRKNDLQKALIRKELKSSENIGNDQPTKYLPSLHDRTRDLKVKNAPSSTFVIAETPIC